MPTHARRSTWFWLAAVLLAASACGSGSSATPSTTASGTTGTSSPTASTVSTGVFQLATADGSTKAFGLGDLKKLPLTSILSDGQPQEGPALLDVLHAAGVSSFGSVTVTGSNGSATLTQAEVTKDVVLDFNNRGKVKLVSPSMPKPKRIIDITKIDVS